MKSINTFDQSPVSRRRFIAFAGLSGLLGISPVKKVLALSSLTGGLGHENFSFADQVGLGPYINAPIVEKYLIPLHREQDQDHLQLDHDEYTSILSILKSLYEDEALEWEEAYDLEMAIQHYGVHYEGDNADKLLKFSKDVHDFLYSNISGLYQAEMHWKLLQKDGSQDFNADGFQLVIGRYTYLVTRVYVRQGRPKDYPYLTSAEPLDRAINYIESGDTSVPTRGLIYLIPGATSLVSPFSELLHLSFHAPSKYYEQELCNDYSREQSRLLAIQAGETINEATALVLASDFQRRYGHIDRLGIINRMASSLSRQFPKLKNVISFMGENGVQQTIDTFFESPSKLMKMIS